MVQSRWTLARLESYKGNTKASLEIRDFKDSKTSSIGSKGQTKNFKRRRRLSGPRSNSNGLKIAHV